MMRRLLSAGMIMFLLASASPAAAQTLATPACVDETYALLAKEQRLFRSVIFGAKKPENLPVNSLLYDKEGKAWLKTKKNEWKEVPKEEEEEPAGGNAGAAGGGQGTKTDSAMDSAKELKTRRGLLEARRTATSDNIPAITQSLRALECRLRAVCELAIRSRSTEKDEEEKLKIQPTGCIEFELPVIKGCSAVDGISPSFIDVGACDEAADGLFIQESNLLSLSVAYDASYRTIAQFSGMFEGFLSDFRFPLINPLWQTVRTMGGLKGLPCFLSQCDE